MLIEPRRGARPVGDHSSLSFESTVARRLVHRAAVSEVFCTDSMRVDSEHFLVAVHLPRRHSFFGDGQDDRYDPLLCLEASRQAGVLVAHEYFGIAVEQQFVLRESAMQVLNPAVLTSRPGQVRSVVGVTVDGRQPADGVPNVLDLTMEFRIEDAPALLFRGGLLALNASIYRQLRQAGLAGAARRPGRQDGAPLAGELVGRTAAANVVLSAAAQRSDVDISAALVVDQAHPVFFDHPLDHVPGTLLIEAHRQAASAAVVGALGWRQPSLRSAALKFDGFVELGVTTPVTALIDAVDADSGVASVQTEIRQGGTVLSAAAIRLGR
jgi:hypothetical protein